MKGTQDLSQMFDVWIIKAKPPSWLWGSCVRHCGVRKETPPRSLAGMFQRRTEMPSSSQNLFCGDPPASQFGERSASRHEEVRRRRNLMVFNLQGDKMAPRRVLPSDPGRHALCAEKSAYTVQISSPADNEKAPRQAVHPYKGAGLKSDTRGTHIITEPLAVDLHWGSSDLRAISPHYIIHVLQWLLNSCPQWTYRAQLPHMYMWSVW